MMSASVHTLSSELLATADDEEEEEVEEVLLLVDFLLLALVLVRGVSLLENGLMRYMTLLVCVLSRVLGLASL